MKIKFVPQDIWVGLYFKRENIWFNRTIHTTWYLCFVPCFPIIWETKKPMPKLNVQATLSRMAANAKTRKNG